MIDNPKILIVNDDGIHSAGIYALWEAMSEIGDTMVVAPETEKSAVGHAITITDPIRIQKITRHGGFEGYSVKGTPADCVKIAISALLNGIPDMVISGINSGANVGNNIIYSGTVSAATEATMNGIPAIAISLASLLSRDFEASKDIAKRVIRSLLKNALPKGTLLNVNVPNVTLDKIKGIKITRQGNVYFKDWFEKREDPRGHQYFWITGKMIDPDNEGDTDNHAIKKNYISISPIHYRLTDEAMIKPLNEWDFT